MVFGSTNHCLWMMWSILVWYFNPCILFIIFLNLYFFWTTVYLIILSHLKYKYSQPNYHCSVLSDKYFSTFALVPLKQVFQISLIFSSFNKKTNFVILEMSKVLTMLWCSTHEKHFSKALFNLCTSVACGSASVPLQIFFQQLFYIVKILTSFVLIFMTR